MSVERPRIRPVPSRTVNCVIWPEYPATQWQLKRDLCRYYSPRAGGGYHISEETITEVGDAPWSLSPDIAKKLSTRLIDHWLSDQGDFLVTTDIINEAAERDPLPIYIRAERLLQYISREISTVGEYVHFTKVTESDLTSIRGLDASLTTKTHVRNLEAYAWSESEDWGEVEYMLDYLVSKGWIEYVRNDGSGVNCLVTVDGYAKIEEVAIRSDSSQCFVAMWFDPSMDEVYDNGIRPAIKAAGYKPQRIDRKEDILDKIDDVIIAEIRKSRFIVADFTHGDEGARGGVYYEAGFAHGLGIPVIFLCRKKRIKDLHFDTRQFPHIDWTTHAELRERLKSRILATLGEGPELMGP